MWTQRDGAHVNREKRKTACMEMERREREGEFVWIKRGVQCSCG